MFYGDIVHWTVKFPATSKTDTLHCGIFVHSDGENRKDCDPVLRGLHTAAARSHSRYPRMSTSIVGVDATTADQNTNKMFPRSATDKGTGRWSRGPRGDVPLSVAASRGHRRSRGRRVCPWNRRGVERVDVVRQVDCKCACDLRVAGGSGDTCMWRMGNGTAVVSRQRKLSLPHYCADLFR